MPLDGYDQTALLTGKSEQSARNFVFYYDETVLTAIRYKQFKITFSAKFATRHMAGGDGGFKMCAPKVSAQNVLYTSYLQIVHHPPRMTV